ncbi:MAG TPA: RIP metalloprotease RseP [Chitinophagales bacterium]|jgi:regulator of sigma E protease|nr:RIP metalloprotease RseP [Chitinophagales bacterium]HPN19068.1 RIP metalloprotease RseP [Chitinophagales bacterium]
MLLFAIGGTATKVILLILSLSILIVLHELGHFIPAKLFGTRVHKFYLFFDFLFPFPNIANFTLFKKKIGDTEYGLGWFPFGGYVQIAGMADETQDAETLKNSEPQPWEFRSKPAWQRLIIMVGGVTVNMVLAMVIFSGLLWKYGEEFLPFKNMSNGIMIVDSLAYEIGLQNGDKIIAIDKQPAGNFEEFQKDLVLNEAKNITIERNGQQQDINFKEGFLSKLMKQKKAAFILPRVPSIVVQVQDGTGAAKAGMKKGDKITAINGVPTPYYDNVKNEITLNKGKEIAVTVERNGQPVELKGAVSKEGLFGFGTQSYAEILKTERVNYNFAAAIPAGIEKSISTLANYFKSLKMLFTSKEVKVKDSLGGFISMGKMFPDTFDWEHFWILTATISVILAFMNILPIPMLDGGYVVFLLYEMVRGKPVPDKVQQYAQSVGMFIILGLLLFANGMDVIRAIFS